MVLVPITVGFTDDVSYPLEYNTFEGGESRVTEGYFRSPFLELRESENR